MVSKPAYPAPQLGLFLLLIVYASLAAKPESVTAIFSREQALWSDLLSDLPAQNQREVAESLHLVIVPPPPPILDESPPCDSCDRLSPNVLEFFLPAWHRDRFAAWLPSSQVEVLSGGNPLLFGDSTFTQMQSTLPALPYAAWLSQPIAGRQNLIYRPRDRMMSDSLKMQFSTLGGRLKASHLLLIDSVKVRIRPWGRSSKRGSFRISYHLVFFNVARGQPEWVKRIALGGPWWSALDAPLEPRLEPSYEAWKRDIPANLRALWDAEPQ